MTSPLQAESPDSSPDSSLLQVAAVVLAGGLGTRMRSRLPKELQPLCGRPLLRYVLDALAPLPFAQRIIVLSPRKQAVTAMLPEGWHVVWQEEPLGTGHALAQALPALQPTITHVLVVFGDHPLVTSDDLGRLVRAVETERPLVAVLTTMLDDPAGYGRIRRRGEAVAGVVEARDDTAHYTGPVEVVSAATCYDRAWLERAMPRLPRSPSGEYYHTALVEMAAETPWPALPVVTVRAPVESALGVNDRLELAQAERVLRQRILERHLRAGVAIVDPATTYIDADVVIEPDARIEPGTMIMGASWIGAGARIGPYAIVRDSRIGRDCVVIASVVEESELGEGVHVGPYSHLRPGTRLADRVHVGNFAELKNAHVGPETRIGHVSYIGDARLGARVNIGAGTITCNYDGVAKHETVIEDEAFIGSDTMLVAPVRVGARARTGAGSVVTHDVPAGETVVGVPARPLASKQTQKTAEQTEA
ncbi:bifunctional UDP-N-acetylglucosamine diphosphorylase/glucosamine-1-phosphate N-acetyltransferase GlmU [Thermorudis peleae]|uniref:bifunctional UDP-N-acetylglucosamine diphosphorylase/glucosamine-1-phosphate N-acetyltransferase GlmU n=1 Tax=Thermorudis peleae TaxID=1382356 RepID=UPI0006902038|nr:bifunctional UDP-N-acetylglucosamine diphosphorylase/glucosamine-1-phosphate N-acetyltransferase GlmU [Thermorudis peleae]